jgi:hypothetical protein
MQDLSIFAGIERRGKTRFPIELCTHYTVPARLEVRGSGLTVNISSRGVLMTSDHDLSPDTPIIVVIEWPVPIDNICPLALHIYGTVVQCERGFVAVRFSTHEFRTRPKPPEREGRESLPYADHRGR